MIFTDRSVIALEGDYDKYHSSQEQRYKAQYKRSRRTEAKYYAEYPSR